MADYTRENCLKELEAIQTELNEVAPPDSRPSEALLELKLKIVQTKARIMGLEHHRLGIIMVASDANFTDRGGFLKVQDYIDEM